MKRLNYKKIKISISMQIAMTFLALLVLVVGVCFFANTMFLEDYYIKNKQAALKSAYYLVNDSLADENYDSEELSTELHHVWETYNISMIVISESTDAVITSMNDDGMMERQLFGYFFGGFSLENDDTQGDDSTQGDIQTRHGDEDKHQPRGKILEKTEKYTISINSDRMTSDEYIEMWGIMDNNYIFMMRSSLDSIADSVAISNRFLVFIGAGIGIISIFIAIWASSRISKPIKNLTMISERMKDLDFEAKYEGKTHNEIAVLGENINELSETLEETISELKTANNELKTDLQRRTEIDDMRKEFLSNVSHELKTPIALIQGYAEGLNDCVADDEDSREFYCGVIIDEANKMNTLVKKLLTLNQLEFGNDTVTMERFDIVGMVTSFVQSADILIRQNDCQVHIEAPETAFVWGDQFKVEEVINNYFTNALNHLDGERKVDITIRHLGDKVRVSVFNTGNPIPEESLPHIWEKFYKVDKARTREYGGSGVGLSIVKAIQDSMNQDYGVINYNNGVEFYFELGI